MKVFVDTEFTSLDNRFMELISVGMIDETGREFYLEVNDFNWSYMSRFVRYVVLPLLGRPGALVVPEEEVQQRVRDWLRSLGEPVTLVVDSPIDIRIVPGLRRAPEVEGAVLLDGAKGALCGLWIDGYFASHRDVRRHHALEDARALRMAYLAVKEDGDRPLNLETL